MLSRAITCQLGIHTGDIVCPSNTDNCIDVLSESVRWYLAVSFKHIPCRIWNLFQILLVPLNIPGAAVQLFFRGNATVCISHLELCRRKHSVLEQS